MPAKKADTKAKDEPKEEPKEEKKEEEAPDYEKKVEELEKQMGNLSKTIDDQNEFIQGATAVVNTIAYNPELREQFQETYQKNMGTQGQTPGQQPQQGGEKKEAPPVQPEQTPTDRRVDEVAASQREEIVTNFEKQYGINAMKEEDRKKTRRDVENCLNDFGWSVRNVPLPQLRTSLEKAYDGTQVDKLREEGKLEGIAQARANQTGTMGGMQDRNISTDTTTDLSGKQKEWLGKLRVDEKGAKKTYQSQDEEYQRVPKGEEKK